jgi:hypothetical protein
VELKCVWFGSSSGLLGTSAALHMIVGMSSSQLLTTTEMFGSRALSLAIAAVVVVIRSLWQGAHTLTCDDRRRPVQPAAGSWSWELLCCGNVSRAATLPASRSYNWVRRIGLAAFAASPAMPYAFQMCRRTGDPPLAAGVADDRNRSGSIRA